MRQTIHDFINVQSLAAGGPGSGRHPEGGRRMAGPQKWTGGGRSFHGYHHHTEGERRQYHILEGAGPNGGEWAAYEAKKVGGGREMAIYKTQQDAEDHVRMSQD